jgi:hypothetical protein
MAIVNKSWRQGYFVPPGAEPGLTKRFVWRDVEQDKAVQAIAADRFDFPNARSPNLKTFTNRPARQVGVRLDENGTEMAFPDIAVLEDPGNEVRMLAEVETHRTLRETPEAALVEKWQALSYLGELYLFVPLMRSDEVKRVLKRHKIAIAGLRTWRFIAGQNALDIIDLR